MEIIIDGLRSRVPQVTAGEFSLSLESGKTHALACLAEGGKGLVCRAAAGGDPLVTARVTLGAAAPFAASSPREALGRGVAALYPRPLVFPALTALENVGVAMPLSLGALRRQVLPQAESLWAELGGEGPFPAGEAAEALAPVAWRRLEIIRALLALGKGGDKGGHEGEGETEPKLLILNEALGAFDVAGRRRVLAALRAHGVTTLFTTAQPRDAALADCVHVLHGGKLTSFPGGPGAVAEAAAALYGEAGAARPPLRSGKTVLEILGMVPAPGAPDYSLTLRQGEILGLTGLDGSGWERFADVFAGKARAVKGVLTVNGKNLRLARASAKALAKAGVAVFDGRMGLPEGSGKMLAAALEKREKALAAVLGRPGAVAYVICGVEVSGEDAAAALLRQKLPELTAAGKAFVLVSPNAEELLRHGDTLAVFHGGALCPPRAVGKWDRDDLELFIDKGKAGMVSLL